MTGPRSLAARALADQAEVAGRDGSALFAALAGQLDSDIGTGVPDGPVADLLARLSRRIIDGQLTCCQHLTRGPEPSWWIPARPGAVRCLPCTVRAACRTPRGREGCSRCSRIRHPLQVGLVLTPAVVLEGRDGSAVGIGPITVAYQLCRDCQGSTDGGTAS